MKKANKKRNPQDGRDGHAHFLASTQSRAIPAAVRNAKTTGCCTNNTSDAQAQWHRSQHASVEAHTSSDSRLADKWVEERAVLERLHSEQLQEQV